MKNSFKKVAALALAILMLLMLVPASLASDGETVSNAVVPGLSDGGTLLTSLKKYSAMFEKLMAEEDSSAFAELAAQYMQDAGFLDWLENSVADGTLSSDQIDALNARTALLLDGTSDVDTLAISGANSVGVGNSITLTGTSSYDWVQYSKHEWESSDTSIATVSSNGSRATVTGVKQGSVTITHRYKVNDYFGEWHTETYNVQVESSVQMASVYYLKSPTSNPKSNATSQWGKEVTSAWAKVDLTGATYDSNNKNIFEPASYILSMPGPKQDDGSYLLPKEDNRSHYTAIYDAYKTELANDLNIDVEKFSENDIEAIYLVPYKISVKNATDENSHNTVHIDCRVKIKCTKAFTVVFWVEKPNEAEQMVDSENYLKNDTTTIKKTTKAPTNPKGDYPNEITVENVEYVFDGWYNEAGEKVTDEQWNDYRPTETELEDGTVNFYAHYEPKTTTVTIIKSVRSDISSDKTKVFGFNYKIDDGNETAFTLHDSQTKNITVNNGSKLVVTETMDDGFDTGYVVGTSDLTNSNSATIEKVTSEGQTITFVNTRKTGKLTISKVVTGGWGDKTKYFNFTLTNPGDAENDSQTKQTTFQLKNDESISNFNFPYGTTVTITEADYSGTNGGYTTSYTVSTGETNAGGIESTPSSVSGRIAEVTINAPTTTVTFTNNKEAITDTGVLLDSLPYILILVAIAVVAGVVIVRRRRNRDDD